MERYNYLGIIALGFFSAIGISRFGRISRKFKPEVKRVYACTIFSLNKAVKEHA